MTLEEDALRIHRKLRGKIEIRSEVSLKDPKILDLIYTPGVAVPAKEIFKDKEKIYQYTSKWNSVAIVTNGTRTLGGNLGPEGALPVMEGKSVLFKVLGGVDAFPICLKTKDENEIVQVTKIISPTFGAINIEDIETPQSLEIVERLDKELEIPVFHDDQHGTGIVTLADVIKSLKVMGKKLRQVQITITGAGAAGYGISNSLYHEGARNILVVDSSGIIYDGRKEKMNRFKQELATRTNPEKKKGTLTDALKGSDIFIGVSGISGLLKKEMIKKMSVDPIVLALSNPTPKIF